MSISEQISFKKPIVKNYTSQGFTCIDMHHHTAYSDGTRKVPALVKKARRVGIGISITDHNEIRGAIEIAKYKDVFSIPGIEITTKEGIHLLLYFYNVTELTEFYNHIVLPNKNNTQTLQPLAIGLVDILDIIKDYNCVFGAPHPYSINLTSVQSNVNAKWVTDDMLKKFDSIEVINGVCLHSMNTKASSLAERLDKGITAGSDGHRLELGKIFTYTKYPAADTETFLKSVLEKKTFAVGKTSIFDKVATESIVLNVVAKHPLRYAKMNYDYIKSKL